MTVFLSLFDGLKERWLIAPCDATFNEQLGRTIGGKLAWCSFCRTELMKPRWIKPKCALYLGSGAVRMPHKYSNYSNICPGCKGSIVSLYKRVQVPLMRLWCTNEAHVILRKGRRALAKLWMPWYLINILLWWLISSLFLVFVVS